MARLPALVVVFVAVTSSQAAAQQGVDFTGRWVIESPIPVPPDLPRALTVQQSLVRTNARGEAMSPFFKDITIERDTDGRQRSELHLIGVEGGTVPGAGPDGAARAPHHHDAVRWDSRALVLESGSYTGASRETGVWTERREVWSLDPDGRLRVVVETRGSGDQTKSTALVYRRQ